MPDLPSGCLKERGGSGLLGRLGWGRIAGLLLVCLSVSGRPRTLGGCGVSDCGLALGVDLERGDASLPAARACGSSLVDDGVEVRCAWAAEGS